MRRGAPEALLRTFVAYRGILGTVLRRGLSRHVKDVISWGDSEYVFKVFDVKPTSALYTRKAAWKLGSLVQLFGTTNG
jgi:hypothetical protein